MMGKNDGVILFTVAECLSITAQFYEDIKLDPSYPDAWTKSDVLDLLHDIMLTIADTYGIE